VGAQAVEGLRLTDLNNGSAKMAFDARYNSVFLVWQGRVQVDRYDKISLTPFGEVIPYVWRWPGLQKLIMNVGAGGMKFDLTSGSALTVFEAPVSRSKIETVAGPMTPTAAAHSDEDRTRVPVVTPICFEATKSDLCRRLVYEGGARRAAIIINMSNDGWFGDLMGGREQHLLAARWRCVELGLPMVRAVNTGISCSIDARGVLRKYGPDGQTQAVNVDGVLVDTVALAPIDGATIFARCGNAFGWIVLVLAALSPVLSWKALRFPRTNKAA
jgi:apolipoprotein N-acyltransferase